MTHYALDVDPDQLELAGTGLHTLGEHLRARSDEVRKTPAEIGQDAWSGGARAAIEREMQGLGGQTARFAPLFEQAGTALKNLATSARTALDTTLPNLNSRWDGAQTTYSDAVSKANTSHDQAVSGVGPAVTGTARTATLQGLDGQRQQAVSAADSTRRSAEAGLDREYNTLVTDLQTQFSRASATLASATVVAVSDRTVADFVSHHLTGLSPGFCSTDGTFPPDLGADDALAAGGMSLVRDMHDAAAGEAAAANFNEFAKTGPHSHEEIEAFLATLHVDSAAFRAAFLNHLELDSLFFFQQVAHHGVDAKGATDYGRVITAIGTMMAAGSNATLQGDYPVRSSLYDAWREKAKHTIPPEEGYLFLAEIVQAGQGGKATWDSTLLTGITRDTIAFEQEQRAKDPYFNWVQVWGGGYPVTAAFGDQLGTAGVPGRADPVAMMFDAMQYDRDASLALLRKPDGTADIDLLHYLYDGRRDSVGAAYSWGDALGGVVNAATTFVGSGGRGTPEYASAQIVSDFVHFFGDDPGKLWPGMEQDVVDMLTHHIQDVNATLALLSPQGDVRVGRPDGLLARDRLTTAILDNDDLKSLMTKVFGLDHYATDGRPLYQQFSAVQTAALRQDFLDVAGNPHAPAGLLEQIAGQHGTATTRTVGWLKDALVGAGASEDEAVASARDAADWVLGLATDKIPVDKLGGPGGAIAGLGVDKAKDWALDHLGFAETHHADEAASAADDLAKDMKTQNALVHLNWLDEVGRLGDAAPDTWARSHPDQTEFLEKGPDGRYVLKDTTQLYQEREEHPEAWNQFVNYWNEYGDPQLRHTDLYENYELGAIGG